MALIYDTWAAAQEDRGLIPPPEDPFNGSEVCSLCGEPSPELTVFRDGLAVCEDCLYDYLRAQAERYTTQYIDDNPVRFILPFGGTICRSRSAWRLPSGNIASSGSY